MVRLFVDVPLASFRSAYARQYWETWPVPPPATVYGMLLSLIGEQRRGRHLGARIALALVSDPSRSRILRSVWKVDKRSIPPGVRPNVGPEWQELLTDVQLCLWVETGPGEMPPALAVRVDGALRHPETVCRFGALCLGESTFLVNDIRLWRRGDPEQGRLLRVAEGGEAGIALPVWADHVRLAGTRWGNFVLDPWEIIPEVPPASAWIAISHP